mmetsp:Transcript_4801/g.8959  ORF Transcript_4801/g.8959 Transcript_4801/m.8959 type:complete len:104 (+) Transcript_4801:1000-1311(+)
MAEDWCPLSYNFDKRKNECDKLGKFEAQEFCASKGGRLCTVHELVGECATGTGCGFDVEFVWTHDEEDDEEAAANANANDMTSVMGEQYAKTERHLNKEISCS